MKSLFRTSQESPYLKFFFCFVFLVLFFLLPTFLNSYWLHLLIFILLYTFLGSSWDILGGYCGQTSFGHASFFGVGAYTSTILLLKFNLSPWFGMFIGGFTGMLFGLFIGSLSFRYNIKEVYFSLTMLTFSEIMRLLFLNWEFVGGASGLLIPIQQNALLYMQFDSKVPYYYIILIMTIFILIINYRILNSKLGDYLMAIRESEESAAAMGVNVVKYKLISIGISSFLTAIGGTFYANYLTYIEPNLTFGIPLSIEILLRPLMGGTGALFGPAVGAFILGPIGEISRTLMHGYSGVHLMMYGMIIIMVILFIPGGIVGMVKNIGKRGGMSKK
jgi:branched-chain amino acid transport system permease protein